MTRLLARLLAPTLAAALLLAPAVADAKPAMPKATGPKLNLTASTMPTLTWTKAKNATSYEIQISSDSGFNPALVDATTQNLRFLHGKTLPNGAYFWRMRALDAAGATSKWTGVRKFTKQWKDTPALLTPASLAAIAYPTPAVLSWTPVSGASTYRVSVATGAAGGGVDAPGGVISTGALAWKDNGGPITTSNTNLAVSTALHPGTYYWQVVPVDPEGHAGTPSAIFSFTWIWAGTTTPTVTDMVPGVEIFDPLFSWAPIPGAAGYQIEINPTADFALGSRVFLGNTGATSYAPLKSLPNNTYYWRVRGVDPSGQAGPWNNGPSFTKTYDETVLPGPANLTVYDTKLDPIAPNGHVDEPVIAWDTVPGARQYEVQLNCNGDIQSYFTTNTAWTPLSSVGGGVPFLLTAPGASVEMDDPPTAVNGRHCLVSVRAYADSAIDNSSIAGHFAQTFFWVGGQSPAFDNEPTVDCDSSCAGLLDDGDIVTPDRGTIVGKDPLFCWTPADMDPTPESAPGARDGITPSAHYWVTIARDFAFTTIVEQAYTNNPCYAPSHPMVDEGTLYYWQVIPTKADGSFDFLVGTVGGFVSSPTFQHASVPPTPIAPVGGAAATGAVVFKWTPVPEQVRNYTIEVAQDPSFSTILESATTDATSYSATNTYPVGATVFWRVRANNDESKGLAWSGTSSFVQTLPSPTITTAAPFTGETFPALSWTPVDGAVAYEIQDVYPDGSVHVTSDVPSTAVSYTKMTGTGHGTVQVRAQFQGGLRSAYTPTRDVVHTISEPGGAKTMLINKPGKLALTFAWNTKPNTRQYKLQVSRNPGFVQPFLEDTTDEPGYTPLLTQQDFVDGGTMYWRVAAIDPDGNTGAYTKGKKFVLLARLQVQISNQPPHGVRGPVTVTVLNAQGKPVKGAAVKLLGSGVKTSSRKTNKKGVVVFTVKPTRAGALTATATKKLFKVGTGAAPIS
jgi:hypothetical protein